MSAIHVIGAIVALGLFVYLVAALFKPEKFQ
jgi:K+-transporting ATPase KdpF subunit